jgi:hypothetical protein
MLACMRALAEGRLLHVLLVTTGRRVDLSERTKVQSVVAFTPNLIPEVRRLTEPVKRIHSLGLGYDIHPSPCTVEGTPRYSRINLLYRLPPTLLFLVYTNSAYYT